MILALICVFVAVAATLVLVLLARIRAAEQVVRLQKHRSQADGFADLLSYAAVVDDGIIVTKAGAFMAAWLYEGADDASSTDDERLQVVARLNQAFNRLGSGWMIHVDGVRRPAPSYPPASESEFPDAVCAAIDEERRQLFERLDQMYEGYFVLTLTWFPPSLAQRKFVEMMFDDEVPPPDATKRTTDLLTQFKNEVASFESRISSAVRLTRLASHATIEEDNTKVTYDDFLAWLQYCIAGMRQRIRLPDNPIYLDALIGGQEFWPGVVPKLGKNYIQVVAIEGFPLEAAPGIMASLNEMQFDYRFSNRYIFLDRAQSIAYLEKFRKKWKQKVRGFYDQIFNTNNGAVNEDAVDMVQQADAARRDIDSNECGGGFLSSNIILMHHDREILAARSLVVEKAVNRLGFAARIETLNTVDAFLGSLPGHGVENVRRPYVNTANLATFLPSSTIWTGSATAPCPYYPPSSPALMHCVTTGATPFRLNLHVADVGHTLMLGPTGAGKSVHLCAIAAQLRRYPRMSIFSFDVGNSMYALTTSIYSDTNGKSGFHYDIGADGSKLNFAPLSNLSTSEDRRFAMEWIDTLCALNKVNTTSLQKQHIATALFSMADSGSKTLSDFRVTVQDEAIRDVIGLYTVDSPYGLLLDADEDGMTLSDFSTFEMSALLEMGDRIVLPVLLYIFRRIQKQLTGQPAAILIDEAWIALAHEAFAAKLKSWLKTLRKANCIVVMATQNVSDASKSGIFDVIIQSTATKIFLANPDARREEESLIYKSMGLNDRQIEIISMGVKKRDYYYVSEKGRRLYELALGPMALALSASDKDSITTIKSLQAMHGNDWLKHWLIHRKVNVNLYREAA